ncbi:MAG: BatD family protein [Chitinophagaceae bacterium]
MRRGILQILLFIICCNVNAQLSFRTVAPQTPVTAGESFEVQFIIEGDVKTEDFTAPAFSGFRFVTGPHIYKGSLINLNISRPLINTVYTLVALKPGRFMIPGATALTDGKRISSNDVFIDVISKDEALKLYKQKTASLNSNSDYFLRPGENPVDKIKKNLFLKVQVDKRTCYVGEPVVATYKLYSRLESKSDIIKNPGFYGFAVYDMVNLASKAQTTEVIDGKSFDVHTVRKVQLYPLQAGRFVVDPMEISNKVEFSRSVVNKKTEQEIVEGVLHGADEEVHNNTEVYENSDKTETIPIVVKPLPAKNKTDSFTAAVGDFTIDASLEKKEIAKNEQGELVVTISGKGNFTQINAPDIKWPAGLDAFEPTIKDSIDKLQAPLTGVKKFHYRFISAKGGNYAIPAVVFNFFNPDTNHFENISTPPLTIQVSSREKEKEKINETKITRSVPAVIYLWLAGVIIVMLAALGILIWVNKKNGKKAKLLITEVIKPAEPGISIDKLLETPEMMMIAEDNNFYKELNKSIWEYLRQKINISGSAMNKSLLAQQLKSFGIEDKTVADLITIMNYCETTLYTDAIVEIKKEDLFVKTKETLKAIHHSL